MARTLNWFVAALLIESFLTLNHDAFEQIRRARGLWDTNFLDVCPLGYSPGNHQRKHLPLYTCKKVAHTRLPNVGFRS